jgi:hypothetical protein
MYFGAVVLAGACYVDRWLGCSQDFAFWFYLSGLLTFWGGLTSQVLIIIIIIRHNNNNNNNNNKS